VSPQQQGVAIIGAHGRMGRFADALLEGTDDFRVVARLDVDDDLELALKEVRPELGLDFTVAGRGFEHGLSLLAAGVRPVIGTSGVSPTETSELDRLAREQGLGGLVVPNFSLGMWLLQRACVDITRAVQGTPWRAEILELHHEKKQDAPSGTALDTARRMGAVSAGDGEVPIHSVRLPGLYAHQEVLFGGTGETLRLRHDMAGPEAFGPGILAALAYATRALGIRQGLGAALEPT